MTIADRIIAQARPESREAVRRALGSLGVDLDALAARARGHAAAIRREVVEVAR